MKAVKIILAFFIIASLALFIYNTDFGKAAAILGNVGYKFVLLLPVTFFAYLFGTAGWRYCLGEQGKSITLTGLFLIRHVGETVSLINPAGIVAGEAVKVYFIKSKGVSKKESISSILLSRAVMILTQLVLFIVVAVLLLLTTGLPVFWKKMYVILLPIFFIGAAFIILAYRNKLFEKRLFPEKFKTGYIGVGLHRLGLNIRAYLNVFLDFFVQQRKAFVLCSACYFLHWLLGAFEFFLILHFLGVDASILQAVFIDMGVVFFKSAGSFVPGQVGVEEYGNKVMLAAIGINAASIWIAASVLRRVRQLFWIVFGFAIYFFMYRKRAETPIVV